MSDDWQWFWAGEGGRDRILREEIGGLQSQLSSASAHTYRLSSQLATLSGSIESRLNALSRAFDAYVELGDVREELAAYDEPADVRREVMVAVEALAGGRPATAVDPRDLEYWLPYAMNAVIALAAGRAATDDLERARSLSPETDLFVVAAAGALGHGATVADLLAGILTADEVLTDHQQTVWRAVAAGTYGGELPEGLSEAWLPQVESEAIAGWSAWVGAHGSTPSSGISWLRTLVTEPEKLTAPVGQQARTEWPLGTLPPLTGGPERAVTSPRHPESLEQGPTPTQVDGLRAVVVELIQRGMPAEEELLRRARELRALIEHPAVARPHDEATTPSTVVSEVRRSLLDPATVPAIRHTLRSWVAPALLRVVDELTTSAAGSPPAQETVRGHGTVVVVSAAGADEVAVQTAEERVRNAYVVPRTPLLVWTVGTAIAGLLTLVLGLAGSGWAWLFAILLLVGAIGSVRQVIGRRQTRVSETEALTRLRQDVADTVARVDAEERQRTELLVQLDGEAADLRRALTALAGDPAAGPVSPARDR